MVSAAEAEHRPFDFLALPKIVHDRNGILSIFRTEFANTSWSTLPVVS